MGRDLRDNVSKLTLSYAELIGLGVMWTSGVLKAPRVMLMCGSLGTTALVP